LTGRDTAHIARNGFQYKGGNFSRIGLDKGPDTVDVVVIGQKGVLGRALGHPRGVGTAKGNGPTACLDQEGIGMSVVTARKFDDLVPARKPPGQPYGTHTGLGAAVHKTDLVHMGHHGDRQSGQFGLDFGGHPKGGSLSGLFHQGIDYRSMGMAQDQGPPRGDIIDEPVAVLIIEVSSLGLLYKDGIPPYCLKGPDRGIDPPGNVFSCLGEQGTAALIDHIGLNFGPNCKSTDPRPLNEIGWPDHLDGSNCNRCPMEMILPFKLFSCRSSSTVMPYFLEMA